VVWSKTDLQAENSYIAGMASIALGCLTAVIVEWARRRAISRWWRWGCSALGWAVIVLIAVWPQWGWMRLMGRSVTDDTLLALGACLVMFAVALNDRAGRWWSAPVRWFGRHSYEVYLSHEFVVIAGVALYARWFAHGASRGVIAGFVVGMVALTAPLGWTLARWFAEPMNRWLRGAEMAK
jgi:peptidoglycan/LPS O-acetylase OafA/YrhL